MPRRQKETGSGAMVLQQSPVSYDTSTMMPEVSILNELVQFAIATVAYQLWRERGCPIGSDQEDWFQAESMLKSTLILKCDDLLRRLSASRCDTRTKSEILNGFRGDGHLEVWEREWGAARWVWDLQDSGVAAPNRVYSSANGA